ncbi:MAG: AtpZ/AtpI family protein [Candidatus Eremiobacteraeota bacterium]|nr:AtpZ/AtpI family protein [Candidatus Eremiobacteraeota bacterium]
MNAALTAGATFAGTVIAGFAAGLWAAKAMHAPLLAVLGLFGGFALGAYAAIRMLLAAGK